MFIIISWLYASFTYISVQSVSDIWELKFGDEFVFSIESKGTLVKIEIYQRDRVIGLFRLFWWEEIYFVAWQKKKKDNNGGGSLTCLSPCLGHGISFVDLVRFASKPLQINKNVTIGHRSFGKENLAK